MHYYVGFGIYGYFHKI